MSILWHFQNISWVMFPRHTDSEQMPPFLCAFYLCSKMISDQGPACTSRIYIDEHLKPAHSRPHIKPHWPVQHVKAFTVKRMLDKSGREKNYPHHLVLVWPGMLATIFLSRWRRRRQTADTDRVCLHVVGRTEQCKAIFSLMIFTLCLTVSNSLL